MARKRVTTHTDAFGNRQSVLRDSGRFAGQHQGSAAAAVSHDRARARLAEQLSGQQPFAIMVTQERDTDEVVQQVTDRGWHAGVTRLGNGSTEVRAYPRREQLAAFAAPSGADGLDLSWENPVREHYSTQDEPEFVTRERMEHLRDADWAPRELRKGARAYAASPDPIPAAEARRYREATDRARQKIDDLAATVKYSRSPIARGRAAWQLSWYRNGPLDSFFASPDA